MVATTEKSTAAAAQKLSLLTMTAMVVGSMVGAGVFSLPRRFAEETGVAGALVAWTVAGLGMLTLAFVFQTLAMRKPELDAGVYAYAKAGFGEYLGFFSAFGYWASSCVGNVTYWALIMSTLGAVIPGLGDGDTVLAVVVSTAGVWGFYFLVRRGIREAAFINRVVTVAKLVPILVFILLALFALKPSVFADNFIGAATPAHCSPKCGARCSSPSSCSSGSRERASTRGMPSAARTWGGRPCSASSAC